MSTRPKSKVKGSRRREICPGTYPLTIYLLTPPTLKTFCFFPLSVTQQSLGSNFGNGLVAELLPIISV
jgi:hypothetical protein